MKHLTARGILSTIVALSSALFFTFAQGEQISSLSEFNVPMKSRTCGLVILSDGRAKVRADDMEGAMADLMAAFSLLQDGRNLEDKASARTASQKILTGPLDHCAANLALQGGVKSANAKHSEPVLVNQLW
jgi:hypothetical protein